MSEQSELPVAFRIGIADEALANEIEAWLETNGGSDLEVQDLHGLLPLIPIVIGGSIAAAAITSLIFYIRSKGECQQLFDFRSGEIKHHIDCRFKNGRIIVIADNNQQVEISDVPSAINFTEIAKTAITAGADAAKGAIEAMGGKAEVTNQDGAAAIEF